MWIIFLSLSVYANINNLRSGYGQCKVLSGPKLEANPPLQTRGAARSVLWDLDSPIHSVLSGHALRVTVVPPFLPKTRKMLSRLSAGALKKATSLGSSRSSGPLIASHSASVCPFSPLSRCQFIFYHVRFVLPLPKRLRQVPLRRVVFSEK
jgi:hypothetical protein